MCQYRYYFFAGCRHQETVLANFCDKASLPPSTAPHQAQPPDLGEARRETAGAAGPAPSTSTSTSPPPAINSPTTASSHYSAEVPPTNTASIAASETTPSLHNMAGLAPLTQTKMKQLITGSPSQGGMNSHFTTNPIDRPNTRPGIHVARKQRAMSDASAVIIVDKPDLLETLDAEVDALKCDIYILRQQAKVSETHSESAVPSQFEETAASRLQKAHELLGKQIDQHAPQAPVAPPSPSHFPRLASTSGTIQSQARRTSYASMATQGMLDAIGKGFLGQKHADGSVSEEDSAQRASSGVEADSVFSPKSDTATTASSPQKQSPRFAQPTLAHSRRADETLRKRKPLPSAWMGSPPNEGTSESEKLPERTGSVRKSRLPVSSKKNYMSPTKAAIQRHIDTKHPSPRPTLAKISTIYPALEARQHLTSPISGGTSPDVIVKLEASPSDVKCMLEQMRPVPKLSQGLLQPIREKLDQIGILKDDAQNVKPEEVAPTPEQSAAELGTKKAVPPHVRAAMRDAVTPATIPTLRATAQVFKPMLAQATPEPQQQDLELADDFVMRFFSDDEWGALSSAVRRAIYTKREEITGAPGRTKQRFAGAGPFSPTPGADVFTTSPLRTYGRAPTPSLSPFTPSSSKPHWTITMPSMVTLGGWAGGDGREIKFTGWGPDAERERQTNLVGEEALMEPPLAPRSQQQWARLAYSKTPCNTLDVIGAVEQMPMPFGAGMAGFCGSCAAVVGY